MAPPVKDLIGKKFGRLLVVSRAQTPKGKIGAYWNCTCDCGKENVIAEGSNLRRGFTKSCGCLNREHEDLKGQTFNRLTVISRSPKRGKVYWLCNCSCGKTGILATTDALKRNEKKSCGCQNQERIKSYDLSGQRFGRLTVIAKSEKQTKKGDYYYSCKCDCGKTNVLVTRGSLLRKDGLNQKSCGCYVKDGESAANRYDDREFLIINYLYKKLRARHAQKGFPIENLISFDVFRSIIMQPCYYCGLEKSDLTKEPYSYTAAKKGISSKKINLDYCIAHNGVDRLDSSLGYVDGNVVPCCKYCNMAKSDKSVSDFLSWVERVFSYIQTDENK